MPEHYASGSIEGRMKVDREFREAELLVRDLEKTVNILGPECKDLEARISSLEDQGCDRGVTRLKFELHEVQEKLSRAHDELRDAWAVRDALLAKKP